MWKCKSNLEENCDPAVAGMVCAEDCEDKKSQDRELLMIDSLLDRVDMQMDKGWRRDNLGSWDKVLYYEMAVVVDVVDDVVVVVVGAVGDSDIDVVFAVSVVSNHLRKVHRLVVDWDQNYYYRTRHLKYVSTFAD
uniref:Uncharacterized protein n=1 Tax=Glossina pallidipes TaxID=7398 RepID=A0A1B0A8K5_GLOPL